MSPDMDTEKEILLAQATAWQTAAMVFTFSVLPVAPLVIGGLFHRDWGVFTFVVSGLVAITLFLVAYGRFQAVRQTVSADADAEVRGSDREAPA